MKLSVIFLMIACLGTTLFAESPGSVKKIELPVSTATFRAGERSGLANALCLTCHSVEYVSTQPPLARGAWKAIVEKMIARYGAPVPTDMVDPIVDYLTQAYSSTAKKS